MTKKLWGGRFSKKTHPLVEKFTKSIHYDYKLAKYDLLGSMAHVEILKKAGYLKPNEADSLNKALDSIYEKFENPKFKPDLHSEDIHTYIQNELQKKVGDIALKIHTARSRNDQVVFATKMYCKMEIWQLESYIRGLITEIYELFVKNSDLIVPGFTHMQHAQPIYLKDYLGAYIKMLERDSKRLAYIKDNMRITLGAGALAGTPIDVTTYSKGASEFLKELKDFEQTFKIEVTDNSIDTVSDRDFVIEILSALSIIAMHLSRLSEDLIIWSTKEFDFIEIDEAFCTGSSLMPQKKNPDAPELIRGHAGRLYGNLVSVLTLMKGLPLTYNRDMQLDKEPLFNSFEIIGDELNILTDLVKTLEFNKGKIEKCLEDESLYATDLVYYLVDKGVPFKNAHTIVGKLIKYSIDNNIEIKTMTKHELKRFSDKLTSEDVIKLFNPKTSVESKRSIKRKG